MAFSGLASEPNQAALALDSTSGSQSLTTTNFKHTDFFFNNRLSNFINAAIQNLEGLAIDPVIVSEISRALTGTEFLELLKQQQSALEVIINSDSNLSGAINLHLAQTHFSAETLRAEPTLDFADRQIQIEAVAALYFYAQLATKDPILLQQIASQNLPEMDGEVFEKLRQFYSKQFFAPETRAVALLTRETTHLTNSAETSILAGYVHGLCDLSEHSAVKWLQSVRDIFIGRPDQDGALSDLDSEPIASDTLRLLYDAVYQDHLHKLADTAQLSKEQAMADLEQRQRLDHALKIQGLEQEGRIALAKATQLAAEARATEAAKLLAAEQAKIAVFEAQRAASEAEVLKLKQLEESHRAAKEMALAEAERLKQEHALAQINARVKIREARPSVPSLRRPGSGEGIFEKKSTRLKQDDVTDVSRVLDTISDTVASGKIPKLGYPAITDYFEGLRQRDLNYKLADAAGYEQQQSDWRSAIEALATKDLQFSLSLDQADCIRASSSLPASYFSNGDSSGQVLLWLPRGSVDFKEKNWGASSIIIGGDAFNGYSVYESQDDGAFLILSTLIQQQAAVPRIPFEPVRR